MSWLQSVAVLVYNAQTELIVSGAKCILTNEMPDNQGNLESWSGYTGDDGIWHAPDLQVSRYFLMVEKAGYMTYRTEVVVALGYNQYDIPLEPGQNWPYSLNVWVEEDSGAPIQGAVVKINNLNTGSGAMGTTNFMGFCAFANLDPGNYFVGASAAGYNPMTGFVMVGGDPPIASITLYLEGSTWAVDVQAGTGGDVEPSGVRFVPWGSELTVEATAENGYVFDYWEGNCGVGHSTQKKLTFVPTNSGYIKAHFKTTPLYTINVTASEGGAVEPAGIIRLREGNSLTVEAFPAERYFFHHWNVGNEPVTSNPYSHTVTGNITIHAVFKRTETSGNVLFITVTGKGSVVRTPEGEVEQPGQILYQPGTIVTLAAVPAAGHQFQQYKVDGETTTEPIIQVTMATDRTVVANFVEKADGEGGDGLIVIGAIAGVASLLALLTGRSSR